MEYNFCNLIIRWQILKSIKDIFTFIKIRPVQAKVTHGKQTDKQTNTHKQGKMDTAVVIGGTAEFPAEKTV